MKISFISSISNITAQQWNELFDTDYPFTRHEFLLALEESGAATKKTGWEVNHVLVYEGEKLISAMPCYLKNHSYGEYVFDFQWANAYQQHGLNYYPKLLSAIPFSPVTGPRIGIEKIGMDKNYSEEKVIQFISESCKKFVDELNLSSWHLNFPPEDLSGLLETQKLLKRTATQFHWFNKGYACFDDFLASCNARHRKNIKKERQKVVDQNIFIKRLEGSEITDELWQRFYYFYQATYTKRSGHGGYLNPEFFYSLGKTMPEQLMMAVAMKEERVVGAALSLKDAKNLYGRYWGCEEEYDFLHFEACYYQGIEYCIEKGLAKFDSGAQGEHKIQRGFEPVEVYSNHWIKDKSFREAVASFLKREKNGIAEYKKSAEGYLPFKK